MKTHRSRLAFAILATCVALGASASVAAQKPGVPDGKGGNCLTVDGGGGSSWVICDDSATTNGLPTGGSCGTGPAAGSGAAIDDAETITGGGDAFDLASMLFVNNVQVAGLASQAGNSVSFATTSVGGLTRSLRYDVLATQATTRVVLSLTNTTGAPITVPLNYVGNFGSDGSTTVEGTFSGDTTFTTADEWMVTSDLGGGDVSLGSDPTNTSVFFGGSLPPPSTPTSASGNSFGCSGTEGYNVQFNATVPAGGAVTYLFFQRMSDTPAIAVAAAADFTNITSESPLLAGLSAAELGRLANFAFGVVAPPAPVPLMSGNVLALLGILLALVGLVGVRLHQSRG